jgi:hypothetical protein
MNVRGSVLSVFVVALGAPLLWSAPAFAAAPEAPVTLTPAQTITQTSAVLEGTLNPGASARAGWYFAYSPEPTCLGVFATALEAEVEGAALPEHAEVSGLQPSRRYTFCLVARNEAGVETPGNEVSFETEGERPAVDGEGVSSVGADGATLEAQVNPNNQEIAYSFEYATNKALAGATTLPGTPLAPGFGDQTASVSTGALLQSGELYYYRVVAKNATGTTVGAVQYFVTVPAPVTGAPGPVGASTAVFGGILSPLNPLVATQWWFDYNLGSECTGGNSTPAGEAGTEARARGAAASAKATPSSSAAATSSSSCGTGSRRRSGSAPGSPTWITAKW